MNRQTRKTVTRLAHDVRNWALLQAREFEEDLCGWCAICSAELFKRLQAESIPARIMMAQDEFGAHVFLNVEDWIVCVTASQFHEFRSSKVLMMHENEAQPYEFFSAITDEFSSVKALIKYQKKFGWPDSQTARP